MNMTVKTMNVYDELAKVLNVKLTDDYRSNGMDLEIGTWNTADGYEVHVITSDARNLEWEYDVYYYEPDFNTVIDRIKDVSYDDDVAVDAEGLWKWRLYVKFYPADEVLTLGDHHLSAKHLYIYIWYI